jgi:hypothetical protein
MTSILPRDIWTPKDSNGTPLHVGDEVIVGPNAVGTIDTLYWVHDAKTWSQVAKARCKPPYRSRDYDCAGLVLYRKARPVDGPEFPDPLAQKRYG